MLAVAAGCCLAFSALAGAELVERGNLFVKFEGGISPTKLPRDSNAPIAVHVAGTVRTLSGERPPALRKISIAINRGGTVDNRGLPVCRRSQVESVSSRQALAVCGPALVGEGSYVGAVSFPEQSAFPLHGRILAFNAIVDGGRAILAHVYGTDPFPNSRIVVFHVRRSRGTFGTLITASLPVAVNRYGYLRKITLDLDRRFVYRGHVHSYLSAACAAPAGLNSGLFPFVRVSMTFSDRRELASTLIRSCQVKSPSRGSR